MKLITSGAELEKCICNLIEDCSSFSFALAWAKHTNTVYNKLKEHKDKIKYGTIGTHFNQTAAEVLKDFIGSNKVHFMLQEEGVFHPKVYCFQNNSKEWAFIIGSANLSKAAFSVNTEACIYIASETNEESFPIFKELVKYTEDIFKQAISITKKDYAEYKIKEEQSQKTLSIFYKKTPSTMNWQEFLNSVKAENFQNTNERLMLLLKAKDIFEQFNSFSKIPLEWRNALGGAISARALPDSNILKDCGWFGSIGNQGYFKQALIDNNKFLAKAIDFIPISGKVTKKHYYAYIEQMHKAFPEKLGIWMITRLLCMKRPDFFICINSANKKKLCKEYNLPLNYFSKPDSRAKNYWEFIEKTHNNEWFRENKPTTNKNKEQDIWNTRVAMLDSIYYEI